MATPLKEKHLYTDKFGGGTRDDGVMWGGGGLWGWPDEWSIQGG